MTDNSNTTGILKAHNAAGPSQMRLVILSMVILIAGIVIGSAGTALFIQKNSGKLAGPIQGGADRMTRQLRERLNLSDEQFGKIEPIIKEHMDKLRGIQDDARPLIESEISEMKADISKLLSDAQKLLWERQIMFLERGFQGHRRMGRGGGSDGSPDGGRPYGHGRGTGRGKSPEGAGRGLRQGMGPYGPGQNRRDGKFGDPEIPMRGESFRMGMQPPFNDHNSME